MVKVWIHTCPPREGLLDPLLESLSRSDVPDFEIRTCRAVGLGAIEDWMVAQLDELCSDHEWVLRLEDDVVVSPRLFANVERWPARRSPYFGVGLLFRFSWYGDDFAGWRVDNFTGSLYVDDRDVAGAQAVLYHAPAWQKLRRRLPLLRGSMMDLGITRAACQAGLRTYVHRPSLVQTSAVSKQACLHQNQHEHHAIDYDPDYERPLFESQDRPVLEWSGGRVIRYLPTHDGNVLQVMVHPGKRGLDYADNLGGTCIIDHDKLLDDPAEAYRRARR